MPWKGCNHHVGGLKHQGETYNESKTENSFSGWGIFFPRVLCHCGWAGRPQRTGLWRSPHPLPQETLTGPMSCFHPWGWDGHWANAEGQGQSTGNSFWITSLSKSWRESGGSLAGWKEESEARVTQRVRENRNRQWVKQCPKLHTFSPIPSLFSPPEDTQDVLGFETHQLHSEWPWPSLIVCLWGWDKAQQGREKLWPARAGLATIVSTQRWGQQPLSALTHTWQTPGQAETSSRSAQSAGGRL